MTKLLVSVRDSAEALVAVESGADLIDVKEPVRGSLGAADPANLAAVIDAVADRRPTSAALGELADWTEDSAERLAQVAGGLSYVKLGLAGCAQLADWESRWKAAVAPFQNASVVAVVYADFRAAVAPEPGEVLAAADRVGAGAVLVDTFDKASGGLLSHWTIADVKLFAVEARRRKLLLALAGSLDAEAIQRLASIAPDYFAVRGAACIGGRVGTIAQEKIRQLCQDIANGGPDIARTARQIA